jgi:Flp pilus assembly protein TadB
MSPPAHNRPQPVGDVYVEMCATAREVVRARTALHLLKTVGLASMAVVALTGPPPLVTIAAAVLTVALPLHYIRIHELTGPVSKLLRQVPLWRLDHDLMLRDLRHAVDTNAPPPWGRPQRWSPRWWADRTEELAHAAGVGYTVFVVIVMVAAPDVAGTAGALVAALYLITIARLRRARDDGHDQHRRLFLQVTETFVALSRQRHTEGGTS